MRKTQLSVKGADGKQRSINCEYVVGKDLHFTVMQNAKKIMPMVPNINKNMNLNDLAGIRDSCALIMILIQLGKMNRVVPNHLMYNREDKDAKKPKSVTLLPMEKMVVNPFGFYIFQVEQGSMKQTLWLVFIVFLIFFFLLFRVWPEWLRLGVWYVSWYLLCFLVSPLPSFTLVSRKLTELLLSLDWNRNRASHRVVCSLAHRRRLLDLPQLLH